MPSNLDSNIVFRIKSLAYFKARGDGELLYKFVWRKYGAVLESIKSTTGLGVEDLI